MNEKKIMQKTVQRNKTGIVNRPINTGIVARPTVPPRRPLSNEDLLNIFGLDLGYVQTKATDGLWSCKFTSIVKRRSDVVASVLKDSEGFVVSTTDAAWNVGSKGSYDFKRERLVSESDTPKLLATLGLYQQETDKAIIDLLVSGLPVDDFKIDDYRLEFEERLKGAFNFSFDGQPSALQVLNTMILPQSAGAFFDYTLTDDGEPNPDTADLASEDVLILDIGGNSTDGCIMEDGLFSQDSFTVWEACGALQLELRRLILKHYRYNMPMYKMSEIISTGIASIGGSDEDVSDLITRAVATKFPTLKDEMSLFVPDFRRFAAVILCGGGAYPYADYIEELAGIPTIVMDNAEEANSRGYRKYGILKTKEGA